MTNTFKVLTSRSLGTTPVKVGNYTVGASTQTTAIGLTTCNTSASPVTVDIYINDGTNSTYLAKSAPIPVGSTLCSIGGDQKLVLMTGYSVFVVCSAASSIDVIMSILEIS